MFEFMHRAFCNGNRAATIETGEMVLILLDGAIEGFAIGEGAHFHQAVELKAFEGAVYRRESHILLGLAQFKIEVLGGNGVVEGFKETENFFLGAGAGLHSLRFSLRGCPLVYEKAESLGANLPVPE